MERLSISERSELWDRWEAGESQRSIAMSVGAFSFNGQDPVVVVGVATTGACGRMVLVASVSG